MSRRLLTALAAGLSSRFWISVSLFVLTLLIYWRTLAPGVYGFDSAEYATGIYTQGIVHPPGYPLYLLIGKLFILLPVGDVAYRLNLMSAFFAALTIALLFLAIDNIIENRFAAAAAVMLFAISNYFWQMALITEVYTAFTASLAATLLILSLWRKTGQPPYLLAFSLLYGLTLTIHTSGVLFAPAFLLLILWTRSWKKGYWLLVPTMFSLLLMGILIPYLYLSARASLHPVLDYTRLYPGIDLSSIQGISWFISGKAYTIFAFAYQWSEIPAEAGRFLAYLWRNFLGLGVIAGLIGTIHMWRRSPAWTVGLGLMFLSNAVFFINYRVMDKDTMFLPAYEAWTVFLAAGLAWSRERVRGIDFDPVSQTWIPKMGAALTCSIVLLGLGLNWRWVDMSKADGYMRFAQGMLAESPPGAVIIAPWSSAVVLEYYQIVEHERPDLLIVNRSRYSVARYYELMQKGLSHDQIMHQISSEEVSFIGESLAHKTVYAVEYDPVLAQRFEYLPEGLAFRLASP